MYFIVDVADIHESSRLSATDLARPMLSHVLAATRCDSSR